MESLIASTLHCWRLLDFVLATFHLLDDPPPPPQSSSGCCSSRLSQSSKKCLNIKASKILKSTKETADNNTTNHGGVVAADKRALYPSKPREKQIDMFPIRLISVSNWFSFYKKGSVSLKKKSVEGRSAKDAESMTKFVQLNVSVVWLEKGCTLFCGGYSSIVSFLHGETLLATGVRLLSSKNASSERQITSRYRPVLDFPVEEPSLFSSINSRY